MKAVEKLTSQLRLSITFSVENTNIVKTAETEALAQNIHGLEGDSEHLIFMQGI